MEDVGDLLFYGNLRCDNMGRPNKGFKLISVSVPKIFVVLADNLVDNGYMASRSEVVRVCINDFIQKYQGFDNLVRKLNNKISNVWRDD